MRAIRVSKFGGPEVLKLDATVPKAREGQVLLKLSSAGVNPVDTYIRSGTYARRPALPYTPGTNGAGVVQSVGDGVTKFKVGDHVYALSSLTGTYADFTVCNEEDVYQLPEKLSFTQGAAIGTPYFSAYRALFHRLHAQPGEIVLVHGASGGVGIATVQLARAYGMVVIGTVGTPEGEAVVRKAGAHHVFNHRTPGYLQQIKDATQDHGADVIIEMLANVNLAKDLDLVAHGGRIGVVGNRGSIEICPRDTMAKESSIVGVLMNKATKKELKETEAALHAGMEAGWLSPIIGREYPLSEASEAHRDIIESSGAQGKMVLVM